MITKNSIQLFVAGQNPDIPEIHKITEKFVRNPKNSEISQLLLNMILDNSAKFYKNSSYEKNSSKLNDVRNAAENFQHILSYPVLCLP